MSLKRVIHQWYNCFKQLEAIYLQPKLALLLILDTVYAHICCTHLYNQITLMYSYFKQLSLMLHQLTLIRLVSMMCFNSKAMPTNDTDYVWHVGCRICLTNHMESISHHITLLIIIINGLQGGNIHMHMYACIQTSAQKLF